MEETDKRNALKGRKMRIVEGRMLKYFPGKLFGKRKVSNAESRNETLNKIILIKN